MTSLRSSVERHASSLKRRHRLHLRRFSLTSLLTLSILLYHYLLRAQKNTTPMSFHIFRVSVRHRRIHFLCLCTEILCIKVADLFTAMVECNMLTLTPLTLHLLNILISVTTIVHLLSTLILSITFKSLLAALHRLLVSASSRWHRSLSNGCKIWAAKRSRNISLYSTTVQLQATIPQCN